MTDVITGRRAIAAVPTSTRAWIVSLVTEAAKHGGPLHQMPLGECEICQRNIDKVIGYIEELERAADDPPSAAEVTRALSVYGPAAMSFRGMQEALTDFVAKRA